MDFTSSWQYKGICDRVKTGKISSNYSFPNHYTKLTVLYLWLMETKDSLVVDIFSTILSLNKQLLTLYWYVQYNILVYFSVYALKEFLCF